MNAGEPVKVTWSTLVLAAMLRAVAWSVTPVTVKSAAAKLLTLLLSKGLLLEVKVATSWLNAAPLPKVMWSTFLLSTKD